MFSDIAEVMAEAKCSYIGSATLTENIDNLSTPANMIPILAEARDPVMRETLRDLGCAQAFRRDLYRKGASPMTAPEQQGMLEELTLAGLGVAMPEGGPTFATSIGSVTGRPDVYQPLLEMLQTDPVRLGQARASAPFSGHPLIELVQAFTLLVTGGYAHPMLPDGGTEAGRAASRRLNREIARANANAVFLPRLAAPTIGSSIGPDVLEALLLGELLDGKPADVASLATDLMTLLARSGRSVQRDGQAVNDPAEAIKIISDATRTMLERRLPLFRRLGMVG
jgi:hypothetical protein